MIVFVISHAPAAFTTTNYRCHDHHVVVLTMFDSRLCVTLQVDTMFMAFLERWMAMFPDYQKRPFFISGESYAGR
jgi:hypothetical protein